jgi:hypothetical protein
VPGGTITSAWGNNTRDGIVSVHASASARTSAIGTPVAGMITWRTDGNTHETYDGALWVPIRHGLFAQKTADEGVTNSSTLQDDDHLTLTLSGSATYLWELFFSYIASTAADLKTAMVVPASATGTLLYAGGGAGITGGGGSTTLTGTIAWDGSGSGSWGRMFGRITTVGSGTFKLQFAQNSTDAGSTTTLYSGSFLRCTRVA